MPFSRWPEDVREVEFFDEQRNRETKKEFGRRRSTSRWLDEVCERMIGGLERFRHRR